MSYPDQGAPRPDEPAGGGPAPHGKRSATPANRLGGLWMAVAGGALVLLLLLIFILENNQDVDIAYFGVHGSLPLGVALLLAAVCGILLVVIPWAVRILQLRRAARRRRAAPAGPYAPQDTSTHSTHSRHGR